MPPLRLTEGQVFAGPRFRDAQGPDGVLSLHLPLGVYDLGAALARLPSHQQPDLLLVETDAYANCLAGGLAQAPGRKILIVADTHHGPQPLRRMLAYATSGGFHSTLLVHDPHHLHWFLEGGAPRPGWIPNPSVQAFAPLGSTPRKPQIVFVGQQGAFHPRRRRLLQAIRDAGLPLASGVAPPEKAAALYGYNQIAFNCSLNGDYNMRTLEVLAAGGFLFTDRLSPQSGLGDLFRPDEHYVDYDGPEEMIEKLRWYLQRPAACLSIARAGHAAWRAAHTPEHRRSQVLAFAMGKAGGLPLTDRRTDPQGPGFGERLEERLRLYEALQALALEATDCSIVFDARLGARVISDSVDLPGLRISMTAADLSAALERLGVAGQVTAASPGTADVFVTDVAGLDLAREYPASRLLVLDGPENRAALTARGLEPADAEGLGWLLRPLAA